ncbi:right-handed parallel beta-helix repeat-containing protein [archaeon]|nr:MAG: right-handed parallel beta-helix repeat-containing protein [archaeon]
MAVEVREMGSAVLEDCLLDRCDVQAVAIYAGGKSLQLLRCIIRHCGRFPNASAILVQSGSTILRQCTIEDNPADGIIVQEDVGQKDQLPPKIIIQDCILKKNSLGMGVHTGGGLLLNNKVLGNARTGIFVRCLTLREKLVFRGNTVRDNGSCQSAMSMGGDMIVGNQSTRLNQVQIDADNDFSVAPAVLPDDMYAAAMGMCVDGLSRLGLK